MKTGRMVGVLHTADFLVLQRDAAGWEEWKPEEELHQEQAARSRRKRPRRRVDADTRAEYRGLRVSDLIEMVEDLKRNVAELKAEQTRLQAERNEAYRARDEILQQNARQVAALTKLQSQLKS